jgi:hypothetical protein
MAKKPTVSKQGIITNAIKTNQRFSEIRQAFVDGLSLAETTATLYAQQIRKVKLSKNRKVITALTDGKIGLAKAVGIVKDAANGNN